MNWVDRWVYARNVYSMGQSQFGFFKSLAHVETAGILLLLVAEYFPNFRDQFFFLIPFGIVGYISACACLGLLLERKLHLVQSQIKFSTQRNVELQEIASRLRRMEAKM